MHGHNANILHAQSKILDPTTWIQSVLHIFVDLWLIIWSINWCILAIWSLSGGDFQLFLKW